MALSVFENHQYGCDSCKKVDVLQPSSLCNCCLTGAPLLRDYLVEINSKDYKDKQKSLKFQFLSDSDGKVYKTTKSKLKKVTKYKDF